MNPEVQLKTNDKTGIFFIEIDGKEYFSLIDLDKFKNRY